MKKLLLLANPYSGKKKGKKILNTILDIFSDTPYNVIHTTHRNHPYEIAKEMSIEDYSGICMIGGDGTMHEVINGMLSRTDKKQIPLGLIPGGTGNSFMHDMNCLDPIRAAKQIIKLNSRKIDLIKIKTNENTYFSFNVAGWGMPPDINILAEKMRWLGPQRYNIASLIEIMKFRKRQCSLTMNGEDIADDYSFVLCCNTINTGKGMKIAPKAKIDDGLIDVVSVKKTSRLKLFKLFPTIFSGNHVNDPVVNYNQVHSISIKPDINSPLIVDGEILGETPCEMTIMPQILEVFN